MYSLFYLFENCRNITHQLGSCEYYVVKQCNFPLPRYIFTNCHTITYQLGNCVYFVMKQCIVLLPRYLFTNWLTITYQFISCVNRGRSHVIKVKFLYFGQPETKLFFSQGIRWMHSKGFSGWWKKWNKEWMMCLGFEPKTAGW